MCPLLPKGLVIIIKPSQKSQFPTPLTLNPVFRRITALGDQQERGNQTRNTLICLQPSLALTSGTQNHHTKVIFMQYEHLVQVKDSKMIPIVLFFRIVHTVCKFEQYSSSIINFIVYSNC